MLWWRVKDLNLRRQSRGIYSPLPLAARATRQGLLSEVKSKALVVVMPKVQLLIAIARNKSNMIWI